MYREQQKRMNSLSRELEREECIRSFDYNTRKQIENENQYKQKFELINEDMNIRA